MNTNQNIMIEFPLHAPDIKLWLDLQEKFPMVFEKMPVILPVPQDAPFEIPRIILNLKDKKGTFSCSLNRIELSVENDAWNLQLIEEILKKIESFVPTRIQISTTSKVSCVNPTNKIYKTFNLHDSRIPADADNLSVMFRKKIQFEGKSVFHGVQISSNYSKKDDITINPSDSILMKQNFLLNLQNLSFYETVKNFICFSLEEIRKTNKEYAIYPEDENIY